jgi:glycosyltransferase involved in cell wall biosynthesis
MIRSATGGRAIFTIASANYIPFAATLMRSLREFHPECSRYIVLADAYREFPDLDLGAELLPCSALDIPAIGNMQLWYNITEFNTAIKPFAFHHFFHKLGHRAVCYLDPDILTLAPLAEAFDALEQHDCILTPHIVQPLQDGKEPSDLTILKSGVYNLGFAGFGSSPAVHRFLDWWSERCVAHCRIDIAANLFTDQRWMDLAPAFLDRHHILRHPGYNLAYWNLVHRSVEKLPNGQWLVDGQPLVFFHFSGIDVADTAIFSRHQTRFSGDNLGAVAELCDRYRDLVKANGWAKHNAIPYAFGSFANGRPIENPMRRWILRAIDDGRLSATEPLPIDSNFFDAADETAAARGITITRTMYQLWLDRRDLQTVFDIYTPDGLDGYCNWFAAQERETDGFDGRTVAAARLLRSGSTERVRAVTRRRQPPWRPVSAGSWPGKAADAIEMLRSDVAFTLQDSRLLLPRVAALVWELREDLQTYFHLNSLDSALEYTAWALTSGIVENQVDPALLTREFIEQLTRTSRLSLHYKDVPLTEGMLMTRGVPLHRDYLSEWKRFPSERAGRLTHGLWFAFVAAKFFRWPAALVEPVKRYFTQETEVACPGLRHNRAEMAFWELRADLQRVFPLSDPKSCWRYLHWLVIHGLHELKLALDDFDPRLRRFLGVHSPRYPGLPQVLEMVHQSRPDLQDMFDIDTQGGRAGLIAWADQHFQESYAGTALEELYPPRSEPSESSDAIEPAQPVHRATVALTGEWGKPSGRGEDVRMAAQALQAAGFSDFVVIDRASGIVLRADGSALPDGCEVDVDVNIVYLNADMAFQDWRFLQRAKVRAGRSIGFWAWELERLPFYWRHAFAFYDEIRAASEFARVAFEREALRPVRPVPLAVSVPRLERKPGRAELGLPAGATVFLFMFDFRSYASRKNPEAVVQAFLRAFPDGTEKVRLLIKTQAGASAADAWARLNEMCSDPRIEIRDAAMDREELLALIDSADAFVSLHRSEGFGRGPAEAMLLGKPVILTGYSGTADFATADCAYVVGYTLKPVDASEYPGIDGQEPAVSWADPDIDEAAAHMRRVHEQPAAARMMGRRGRARIAGRYSLQAVGKQMLEALGQAAVEAQSEPPAEAAIAEPPTPAQKGGRRPRKRPVQRQPAEVLAE